MDFKWRQVKQAKNHLNISSAIHIEAYIYELNTSHNFYNLEPIFVIIMNVEARFPILFDGNYTLKLCASNILAKLKSFLLRRNSYYPSWKLEWHKIYYVSTAFTICLHHATYILWGLHLRHPWKTISWI